MKVNFRLLPVKLHYFFFMAASGAVLPFLQVMGKQLGVSEVVMGSITALLPPLYLLAKPLFGVIVDHFSTQRRNIFLLVLAGQNVAYGCLYFIPNVKGPESLSDLNVNETFVDPLPANGTFPPCESPVVCATLGPAIEENGAVNKTLQMSFQTTDPDTLMLHQENNLYITPEFWIFVLLMSVGTVFFNVANSVSDAITFDLLGEGQEMSYGGQRVWGTVGFGLAALLSGAAMQWWTPRGGVRKNYAPALALALLCGAIDLLLCHRQLQVPLMPRSNRILRDVGQLICRPQVAVFLTFAAVCGILDGFITYYLFWYLEDLALASGELSSVKLLEGLVVGAETLIGETAFFYASGRILKALGVFARGLTLALLAFALRLGLVSMVTSPWMLLPIEAFMQGPTYALSYAAIVGYAASVSPPGASATVQGLVAGVDDGLGYAIGSMLGGVCYKFVGGAGSFRVFAAFAAISALLHHILVECCHLPPPDQEKCRVEYRAPKVAAAEADNSLEPE